MFSPFQEPGVSVLTKTAPKTLGREDVTCLMITGASGYVGHFLLNYFLTHTNYFVIALYNSNEPYIVDEFDLDLKALQETNESKEDSQRDWGTHDLTPKKPKRFHPSKRRHLKEKRLQCIQVDLTVNKSVDQCMKSLKHSPQIVIHCAGMTSPAACEKNPEYAYICNNPTYFLESLQSLVPDSLFIVFSTEHVYDGKKTNISNAYTETSTIFPINTYGKSKKALESFVRRTCKYHIILRSSLIYGPTLLDFIARGQSVTYALKNDITEPSTTRIEEKALEEPIENTATVSGITEDSFANPPEIPRLPLNDLPTISSAREEKALEFQPTDNLEWLTSQGSFLQFLLSNLPYRGSNNATQQTNFKEESKKVTIFNNEYRSFVCVFDIVYAVQCFVKEFLLEGPQTSSFHDIYNMAGTQVCSRVTFARYVCEVFGRNEEAIDAMKRSQCKEKWAHSAPNPEVLSLNSKRLYGAIGYSFMDCKKGLEFCRKFVRG